jgi:multimeric flavodoxin WrbA
MKIVCLLGSPRSKGNSAALAEQFCQTVKELGGDVETFALNKMTYRGCQGCMMCKTKLEKCAVKDDLEAALDSVRDADILVMATPTYYGEVSSQMKGFIDRTFSYLKPDYMTNAIPSRLQGGKKLVFIQTQAQSDENQFADVFPRYKYFFKWYGFDDIRLVRACGVMGPGEVNERKDAMELAIETAKKLMVGKG